MIIIKLADGSFAKISNADYKNLESQGIVNLDKKIKSKEFYKNKIISSPLIIKGATTGRLINRYRAGKEAFINALNELEQDGEIQSVYSSKIYDGEQIRTIFKIV